MHTVDGAALKRLEQFARWNDLVGIEQFDLKLALAGRVDRINGGFCYFFTKGRTGIGSFPARAGSTGWQGLRDQRLRPP